MLQFFIERCFSATYIASLLQVSLSTDMRFRQQYTVMPDLEPDRMVTAAMTEHPNWGYCMMSGHLRSIGYRVQQARVRECMIRLDPEGVVSRWITTISRHTYPVPAPNSLWHVDGNSQVNKVCHTFYFLLKSTCLIYFCRWRFVIDAGIDGFSRLPLYCACLDNNRAGNSLLM